MRCPLDGVEMKSNTNSVCNYFQKMDDCADLAEFDSSPLDLSLMNFSFKVSLLYHQKCKISCLTKSKKVTILLAIGPAHRKCELIPTFMRRDTSHLYETQNFSHPIKCWKSHSIIFRLHHLVLVVQIEMVSNMWFFPCAEFVSVGIN